MKRKRLLQMIAGSLVLVSLYTSALAQEKNEPSLERVEQKTEYGFVAYPMLTGLEDELTQVTLNLRLLECGQVQRNLDTLFMQSATGFGMQADYEALLQSGILSVAFSIKGDLGHFETEQQYLTLNYDLENKREITLEDIFTDLDGAVEKMESIMQNDVAPLLSGYAQNEEVTPLPKDTFSLSKEGITFYYDNAQLLMLSGYAGNASFDYYELKDYLKLEEGSVLSRLKADAYFEMQPDSKELIAEAVTLGKMPGVSFKVGDMLSDAIAAHRLLSDPDYYPGGRFFLFEDGRLRDVWALCGTQIREYTETEIVGIRAQRMNLYGLQTGLSTMADWQALLGDADLTVTLDAYTAGDYYLPAGTMEHYNYGDNQLRLHADEDGVLRSIQIIQQD